MPLWWTNVDMFLNCFVLEILYLTFERINQLFDGIKGTKLCPLRNISSGCLQVNPLASLSHAVGIKLNLISDLWISSKSFFCHLYDHVADEDDEGDRESDDEWHVDILRGEASLSVVLDLTVLLKSLLLLVLQRVDLLTVVDHLRRVFRWLTREMSQTRLWLGASSVMMWTLVCHVIAPFFNHFGRLCSFRCNFTICDQLPSQSSPLRACTPLQPWQWSALPPHAPSRTRARISWGSRPGCGCRCWSSCWSGRTAARRRWAGEKTFTKKTRLWTVNLGVGGFWEPLSEDRHHGSKHKQGGQGSHKP